MYLLLCSISLRNHNHLSSSRPVGLLLCFISLRHPLSSCRPVLAAIVCSSGVVSVHERDPSFVSTNFHLPVQDVAMKKQESKLKEAIENKESIDLDTLAEE